MLYQLLGQLNCRVVEVAKVMDAPRRLLLDRLHNRWVAVPQNISAGPAHIVDIPASIRRLEPRTFALYGHKAHLFGQSVGSNACSGDMLLEALVACAGVTLNAVATALEIPLRQGRVRAEGDLDFRGTLGVAKDAAVGFKDIRLHFDLETDASEEQLATLMKLTERYCVVYQTLCQPPQIEVTAT